MEKNIKVMIWSTEGADDGGCVYNLEDPDAGERFFTDLQNNAEMDGRESFKLELWDKEQWDKAEKLGAEMA